MKEQKDAESRPAGKWRMLGAMLAGMMLPCLAVSGQESVAVTPGEGQVTLAWEGAPVDSVVVTGVKTLAGSEASPLLSPCIISGLDNGRLYAFEVFFSRAGRQIDVGVLYTIPGEPAAPRNLKLTPGDRRVTLAWEPPVDGKHYVYKLLYEDGRKEVIGEDLTTFTLTSLPNGQPCTFRLIAVQHFSDFPGKERESWDTAVVADVSEFLSATPGEAASTTGGVSVSALPGQLQITTPAAGELMVYTLNGLLYARRPVPAGATLVPASKGMYFVTLGNYSAKVSVL